MISLTEQDLDVHFDLLTRRHDLTSSGIDLPLLERCCPLEGQPPEWTKNSQLPRLGLGSLDCLPCELLDMVLSELDIQSLYTLRMVNRQYYLLVEALPLHKSIKTQAPNLLRAVLSTRIAKSTSFQELYHALCSSDCIQCGDFAPYIYLLTCSRVCSICMQEERSFLPIMRTTAKEKYGLNAATIATLPSMTTLPGCYKYPSVLRCKRFVLVDSLAAEQAGKVLHTSFEAMQKNVAEKLRNKSRCYNTHSLRKPNLGAIRFHLLKSHDGKYDGKANNPRRYMSVLPSPWLDRHTGKLQWGFSCRHCERDPYKLNRNTDFRRVFTRPRYVEHFKECRSSQDALKSLVCDQQQP